MVSRLDQPDTSADGQIAAILAAGRRKNFTVIAGAGSGKTTSLVKALAHITHTHGRQLRQTNQTVACVTYTDVAAQQIFADVGNDPLVRVSTIHSLLWSIIEPFQRDLAKWAHSQVQNKRDKKATEIANFSSRVQDATRAKADADILRYEQQLTQLTSVERFQYGVGSNLGKGVLGHEDVITAGTQIVKESPLLARVIARKHPFILVDESQDTFPIVVEMLKRVAEAGGDKFCLGFFGDPMQKIYVRGIGAIEVGGDSWVEVKKPENFRSPKEVLKLTNAIRADGDGLIQVSGLHNQKEGSVHFFIGPSDDARTENLERVRRWLDGQSSPGSWTNDDPRLGAKVLVIEHRMAARRFGFGALFASLNDSGPDGLKDAFREGTAWPLRPFLQVLLPLARAEGSEVVALLRRYSPLLQKESLQSGVTVSKRLAELAKTVAILQKQFHEGADFSLGELLDLAIDGNLLEIDPRLLAMRRPEQAKTIVNEESVKTSVERAMLCDVRELIAYERYIGEQSPYSTHQGVKGAEFPRVVVVLDDEEANHNSFSYEKYLKIVAPPKKSKDKGAAGGEDVITRTRRLFYVCCSRATESLAVVLFVKDVASAVTALNESDLPGAAEAFLIENLPQGS